MLVCDYTPYQKWCFENVGSLGYNLHKYRLHFLKRKNIQKYKKSKKGTPIVIDKMINSFDRKIQGITIFSEEVKNEYFKGINEIMSNYYLETFLPKKSKYEKYISFLADQYFLYGKDFEKISFKQYKLNGKVTSQPQ